MFDYDPRTADEIAEKGLYVDPTLALGHLNRMRAEPDPERAAMMRDPSLRFEILKDMWDRGYQVCNRNGHGSVLCALRRFCVHA